jgi:hypothetical protein
MAPQLRCARCPDCGAHTVRACDGGLDLFPWTKSFGCITCHFTWFVCARNGCQQFKQVFSTRRQLKEHARYWHKPRLTVGSPLPTFESNDFAEMPLPNGNDDDDDVLPPVVTTTDNSVIWNFSDPGTDLFYRRCIKTSVNVATHCLVHQALVQAPVTPFTETTDQLKSTTIQLFLYISKLVVNTGTKQQIILCHILSMLFDMLPKGCRLWPTMPCSLPGFQSHILNPSNKNSLVSLLPGPKITMVDAHHAYCSLEEIAAFILFLPRTMGAPPIPLRLHQLCECHNMQTFLNEVEPADAQCLVSIGLLFWLDGWDPSTSSKNNRTPVHTASATFLLIDTITQKLFDCRTFPIACGPGKVDHNII